MSSTMQQPSTSPHPAYKARVRMLSQWYHLIVCVQGKIVMCQFSDKTEGLAFPSPI